MESNLLLTGLSRLEASGMPRDLCLDVEYYRTLDPVTLSVTINRPPPPQPGPPPIVIAARALFDFDHAELRAGAWEEIEHHVSAQAAARADLSGPITVSGHTDSVSGPDPAYNQRLSLRRARAIQHLLEAHYPRVRGHIVAVGYGDTVPVAPNRVNGHDNPAGREQNRRVEIELHER